MFTAKGTHASRSCSSVIISSSSLCCWTIIPLPSPWPGNNCWPGSCTGSLHGTSRSGYGREYEPVYVLHTADITAMEFGGCGKGKVTTCIGGGGGGGVGLRDGGGDEGTGWR